MIDFAEYQRKNKYYSDYLPQLLMISEDTVLSKNCIFSKTIKVRGFDSVSLNKGEVLNVSSVFNEAVRRLGDGWCLWFDFIKRETEGYKRDVFEFSAAQELDDIRYAKFQENKFFKIEKYITIGYQANVGSKMKTDKYLLNKNEGESIIGQEQYFQAESDNFILLLRAVFSFAEVLKKEELLSYLYFTTTLKTQPVGMPEVPFYLDVILGSPPVTGSCPLQSEDKYIYTANILDYPSTLRYAMFDELVNVPIEFRWCTRFIPLGRDYALKYVKKQRDIFFNRASGGFISLIKEKLGNRDKKINTEEVSKLAGTEDALKVIGEDLTSFGYLTTCFILWDTDEKQARDKINYIKERIEQKGVIISGGGIGNITSISERFNTLYTFLGAVPSHVSANIRKPVLSSVNFSHIVHLFDAWEGNLVNTHLLNCCGNGNPLFTAMTTGGAPFRFNLHVKDVGHSLMFGPTGKGKSTFLMFLACQFLRYPKARVTIFDKGKSAYALTKNLGGRYYELGVEEGVTGAIVLQPLNIKDEEDFIFALGWIKEVLILNKINITTAMNKELDAALRNVWHLQEDKERTISAFIKFVQNEEVKSVFKIYSNAGAYGKIFDGNNETIEDSSWVMYEMEQIMKRRDDVFLPALSCLFHRVEKKFDGEPSLIIIDEGWQIFKHTFFAEKVMEWLRTLRKKNCSVVFATQEVSLIDDIKAVIDTLVNACATKIFLSNENALQIKEIYEKFGLTESEINFLQVMAKKGGRYYYMKNIEGSRVFDLELDKAQLKIIRGEGA